jgi:hypothetical protein
LAPDYLRRSRFTNDRAQAAPQITVTVKQVPAELAESHGLPKKQAEAVLGVWWRSPRGISSRVTKSA